MDRNQHNDKKGLKSWNWGAFLLTWIWGAGNNVWIALLALIPGVHLVMAIILGIKGTAWAWSKNRYLNHSEFIKIQKTWAKWGAVITILAIIFCVILLKLTANYFEKTEQADVRDAQRADDVRNLISAVNKYKLDHQTKCPQTLFKLAPDYIKKIPKDPNGSDYSFTQEGEECIVSAIFEDNDNIVLSEDSNTNNGNIFDLKSEDISKLRFYEE